MFELMGASRPMYVLELPQKADDADAFDHWTHEVRKLKEHLELRFNVRITDDKLCAAIHLMNRERGLRRQLADLMAHEPPPLTGRQLLEFKSIISGLHADLRQYERAIQWYCDRAAGLGAPKADAPAKPGVRVMLTGVPIVHGAERVLELIESNQGIS